MPLLMVARSSVLVARCNCSLSFTSSVTSLYMTTAWRTRPALSCTGQAMTLNMRIPPPTGSSLNRVCTWPSSNRVVQGQMEHLVGAPHQGEAVLPLGEVRVREPFAEGGVGRHNAHVLVQEQHAAGQILGDGAVAILALAQQILGDLALGDVGGHARHAIDVPRLVGHGEDPPARPVHAAVGPPDAAFALGRAGQAWPRPGSSPRPTTSSGRSVWNRPLGECSNSPTGLSQMCSYPGLA